ncbi:hypothetical protein GQR58_006566 [Nymphon striatum]|nr:hypothetical protein GQR58_006566 [Nymphon striatum]
MFILQNLTKSQVNHSENPKQIKEDDYFVSKDEEDYISQREQMVPSQDLVLLPINNLDNTDTAAFTASFDLDVPIETGNINMRQENEDTSLDIAVVPVCLNKSKRKSSYKHKSDALTSLEPMKKRKKGFHEDSIHFCRFSFELNYFQDSRDSKKPSNRKNWTAGLISSNYIQSPHKNLTSVDTFTGTYRFSNMFKSSESSTKHFSSSHHFTKNRSCMLEKGKHLNFIYLKEKLKHITEMKISCEKNMLKGGHTISLEQKDIQTIGFENHSFKKLTENRLKMNPLHLSDENFEKSLPKTRTDDPTKRFDNLFCSVKNGDDIIESTGEIINTPDVTENISNLDSLEINNYMTGTEMCTQSSIQNGIEEDILKEYDPYFRDEHGDDIEKKYENFNNFLLADHDREVKHTHLEPPLKKIKHDKSNYVQVDQSIDSPAVVAPNGNPAIELSSELAESVYLLDNDENFSQISHKIHNYFNKSEERSFSLSHQNSVTDSLCLIAEKNNTFLINYRTDIASAGELANNITNGETMKSDVRDDLGEEAMSFESHSEDEAISFNINNKVVAKNEKYQNYEIKRNKKESISRMQIMNILKYSATTNKMPVHDL